MFLGINADVAQWNSDFTGCSLVIYDNPFAGKGVNIIDVVVI